jgi:hypothetical protein
MCKYANVQMIDWEMMRRNNITMSISKINTSAHN